MSFAPCLTDDFSQEKRPQKTMENAVGWTQRATRARLSPSTKSTRRALSPLIHRIDSPSIYPLQCIASPARSACPSHHIEFASGVTWFAPAAESRCRRTEMRHLQETRSDRKTEIASTS